MSEKDTSNVISINGGPVPEHVSGEPCDGMIRALERLLEMARNGEIQSFIGTGFTHDGQRLAVWSGGHSNVYEMLGSLSWLEHEYVSRTTEALGHTA